jgi:superfamily II DNA or RNA helicase
MFRLTLGFRIVNSKALSAANQMPLRREGSVEWYSTTDEDEDDSSDSSEIHGRASQRRAPPRRHEARAASAPQTYAESSDDSDDDVEEVQSEGGDPDATESSDSDSASGEEASSSSSSSSASPPPKPKAKAKASKRSRSESSDSRDSTGSEVVRISGSVTDDASLYVPWLINRGEDRQLFFGAPALDDACELLGHQWVDSDSEPLPPGKPLPEDASDWTEQLLVRFHGRCVRRAVWWDRVSIEEYPIMKPRVRKFMDDILDSLSVAKQRSDHHIITDQDAESAEGSVPLADAAIKAADSFLEQKDKEASRRRRTSSKAVTESFGVSYPDEIEEIETILNHYVEEGRSSAKMQVPRHGMDEDAEALSVSFDQAGNPEDTSQSVLWLLVQWKGLPTARATWEPALFLTEPEDLPHVWRYMHRRTGFIGYNGLRVPVETVKDLSQDVPPPSTEGNGPFFSRYGCYLNPSPSVVHQIARSQLLAQLDQVKHSEKASEIESMLSSTSGEALLVPPPKNVTSPEIAEQVTLKVCKPIVSSRVVSSHPAHERICLYAPPDAPQRVSRLASKAPTGKLLSVKPCFQASDLLSLREYQQTGLAFLMRQFREKRGALLADEMGLGKTIQTLALLQVLVDLGRAGPFLVVAPLSTLKQWQGEARLWTDLDVMLYHGDPSDRLLLRSHRLLGLVHSQLNKASLTRFTAKNISGLDPEHPAPTPDIVLTSYEMLMADAAFLTQIQWQLLVVDEAHRLRNPESHLLRLLSKSLRVQDHRSVLLTGTPLQNNVMELRCIMNFVANGPNRGATLSSSPSKNHFTVRDFEEKFGSLTSASQVSELQKILSPFTLRRTKAQVASSLPLKQERLVYVELTYQQKQWYRALLDKNRDFLGGAGGVGLDSLKGKQGAAAAAASSSRRNVKTSAASTVSKASPQLLNVVMELRKCCNHPFLLAGAEERIIDQHLEANERTRAKQRARSLQRALAVASAVAAGQQVGGAVMDREEEHERLTAQFEQIVRSSGKMIFMDGLLPALRSRGSKVLIFSQFTSMLNLLEEFCTVRGFAFERIDGSISGTERAAAIERFMRPQGGRDPFVFLLSTRAGGLGLNLQSADTVILFDSDWNPQNDLQAMARSHRIGQTKAVTVYRLLTRGTIENAVFQKASMKLGLGNAVFGGTFASELEPSEDASSAEVDADDDEEGMNLEKMNGAEIEKMLRLGAYAALLEEDEEAEKRSRQFEEEGVNEAIAKALAAKDQDEKAGEEQRLARQEQLQQQLMDSLSGQDRPSKRPRDEAGDEEEAPAGKRTKDTVTAEGFMIDGTGMAEEKLDVDVMATDFWERVLEKQGGSRIDRLRSTIADATTRPLHGGCLGDLALLALGRDGVTAEDQEMRGEALKGLRPEEFQALTVFSTKTLNHMNSLHQERVPESARESVARVYKACIAQVKKGDPQAPLPFMRAVVTCSMMEAFTAIATMAVECAEQVREGDPPSDAVDLASLLVETSEHSCFAPAAPVETVRFATLAIRHTISRNSAAFVSLPPLIRTHVSDDMLLETMQDKLRQWSLMITNPKRLRRSRLQVLAEQGDLSDEEDESEHSFNEEDEEDDDDDDDDDDDEEDGSKKKKKKMMLPPADVSPVAVAAAAASSAHGKRLEAFDLGRDTFEALLSSTDLPVTEEEWLAASSKVDYSAQIETPLHSKTLEALRTVIGMGDDSSEKMRAWSALAFDSAIAACKLPRQALLSSGRAIERFRETAARLLGVVHGANGVDPLLGNCPAVRATAMRALHQAVTSVSQIEPLLTLQLFAAFDPYKGARSWNIPPDAADQGGFRFRGSIILTKECSEIRSQTLAATVRELSEHLAPSMRLLEFTSAVQPAGLVFRKLSTVQGLPGTQSVHPLAWDPLHTPTANSLYSVSSISSSSSPSVTAMQGLAASRAMQFRQPDLSHRNVALPAVSVGIRTPPNAVEVWGLQLKEYSPTVDSSGKDKPQVGDILCFLDGQCVFGAATPVEKPTQFLFCQGADAFASPASKQLAAYLRMVYGLPLSVYLRCIQADYPQATAWDVPGLTEHNLIPLGSGAATADELTGLFVKSKHQHAVNLRRLLRELETQKHIVFSKHRSAYERIFSAPDHPPFLSSPAVPVPWAKVLHEDEKTSAAIASAIKS